ncbi:hypothetical protein GJ496_003539, partial [Pomphorhynchus laevis]
VRGFKRFANQLPSDVRYLSLVVNHLQNHCKEINSFTVFIAWLATLVTVPFDLISIVSFDGSFTLTDKILSIVKMNINGNQIAPKLTALVISRFLIRNDIFEQHFSKFMEFLISLIDFSAEQRNIHRLAICLIIFARLLKCVKPKDMLLYRTTYEQLCINHNFTSQLVPIPILNIKILSRFCINCCGANAMTTVWRYNRSTMESVSNCKAVAAGDGDKDSLWFECCIHTFLQHLLSDNINIRWTASKNLARVLEICSTAIRQQVIDSVIDLLNHEDDLVVMQGGCLCIAEMVRRSIIPEDRIEDVFNQLPKGLQCDVIRVNCSNGSGVRDAACYAAWSFARAYQSDALHDCAQSICRSLVNVMLFDRDSICRMAASAAFQEFVGRQKNIAHGIDILICTDSVQLTTLSYCYTDASVQILKYEEYRYSILRHVIYTRCHYWDRNIRELSSQFLLKATSFDTSFIINEAIPHFMKNLESDNFNVLHGTVLALSSCLSELYRIGNSNINDVVSKSYVLLRQIMAKFPYDNEHYLCNIYPAVCYYISKIFPTKLIPHHEFSKDLLYNMLETCLSSSNNCVQSAAIDACEVYFVLISNDERGMLSTN